MKLSAKAASLQEILPWRDPLSPGDELPDRARFAAFATEEYILLVGKTIAGYGSIAVGGPWKDKPTVFEFFVLPIHRSRSFDLFQLLLDASGAMRIEIQSNDPLIIVMLHTFAHDIATESILFHDRLTTTLSPNGAVFRRAKAGDGLDVSPEQLDSHGVGEFEGKIAATGGILFHYNRPTATFT